MLMRVPPYAGTCVTAGLISLAPRLLRQLTNRIMEQGSEPCPN